MLTMTVPEMEFFDERTGSFISVKSQTLQLEHSLISLSRWESKWKKPFLSLVNPSLDELQDYVRCMCLNQSVDPMVFRTLGAKELQEIQAYISDPHTATTITDRRVGRSSYRNEIITSELIYYWMIDFEIPFSCEKWHLQRLLTLIRICGIKSTPEKRMSKNSIFAQNKALNARRRAMLHSKG